ncbi:GGDEF domain-containing protein [uncultured Vibrio sp.]|uniref:GGDEF domain-containing protein n=1 Tax=uncultured Vibrio sp. TaxID=114054 RepID=UPI000922EF75|nr:GGDEF domain-containing protein [uncultured Vibrio sp.]OIQ26616.1 MAG: GGDEF domain-containing protein [Vibrio sp. MedPE-SWchi]
MPLKTHNFIAEKLVEVVEDKHRRQRTMVNTFTAFGLIFLFSFSFYNFSMQNDVLGTTLFFFSIASLGNIYVMNRWRNAGLVGLTTIIYTLSFYLVISGGHENTGTLWIYLLAAISIFINPFRQGLKLSITFIVLLSVILMNDWVIAEYSDVVKIRFVITLFALSIMCHILIYFQSKADDYILKMHEEDIHKLAYFDGLTQLANRSTFRSILERTMNRNETKRSALIYIDLDNFKKINDDYGHDQGDSVLSDFGVRLKQLAEEFVGEELGKYDVARLGGDEFAVFIGNVPEGDQRATELAKEVIALFEDDKIESLMDITHSVSASIGVVFTSTNETNLHDSLKLADKAMYQAKKANKGQVRVLEA